jgi:Protein of unknown function (DUF2934)
VTTLEDKNLICRVRERAFEHFVQRGGQSNGDAVSDWLAAEKEIKREPANTYSSGPAKADDETRSRGVVDRHGHDFENPT